MLIAPGERTLEDVLIEAIAPLWFEILDHFRCHPESIYEIDSRTWEEIIAGAWKREGYEVELTPRSGDKGRDVSQHTRGGAAPPFASLIKLRPMRQEIPLLPQRSAQCWAPSQQLGTLTKGVITTTSRFAPRIMDDEGLARNIPFRLELKDRDVSASSTAATGRCQSRVSGALLFEHRALSGSLEGDHVPASIAQRCQDRKELLDVAIKTDRKARSKSR